MTIQRAFLYGDLLIETIRVNKGLICLEEKHYNRLVKSAQLLQLDLSTLSQQVFRQQILGALNGQQDARVRFVVYRDSGGFYTPQSSNSKWEIDVFPFIRQDNLCEQLGVFREYTKPCHALSNVKSGNALVYVMAGLYAKEQELSDCLILNQYGRIAEATSSNVFIVRGEKIITPPLSEGCVQGVMRERIIEIIPQCGMIAEETPISPDELLNADEVFLTNAIQGIVSVSMCREKEYAINKTLILKEALTFSS